MILSETTSATQQHLRGFSIELMHNYRDNCRDITILDNRHDHQVTLRTWDWDTPYDYLVRLYLEERGISVDNFTYMKGEQLLFLTTDFATPIHDAKIPSWSGGIHVHKILEVERVPNWPNKGTEIFIDTSLTTNGSKLYEEE